MSEKRFVVRMEDGRYFIGNGYAGPGKPVPYFENRLTESTKLYKTQRGAREAAERIGGKAGVVELDKYGRAVRWLGYAIKLGSYDRYAVYGEGRADPANGAQR